MIFERTHVLPTPILYEISPVVTSKAQIDRRLNEPPALIESFIQKAIQYPLG